MQTSNENSLWTSKNKSLSRRHVIHLSNTSLMPLSILGYSYEDTIAILASIYSTVATSSKKEIDWNIVSQNCHVSPPICELIWKEISKGTQHRFTPRGTSTYHTPKAPTSSYRESIPSFATQINIPQTSHPTNPASMTVPQPLVNLSQPTHANPHGPSNSSMPAATLARHTQIPYKPQPTSRKSRRWSALEDRVLVLGYAVKKARIDEVVALLPDRTQSQARSRLTLLRRKHRGMEHTTAQPDTSGGAGQKEGEPAAGGDGAAAAVPRKLSRQEKQLIDHRWCFDLTDKDMSGETLQDAITALTGAE
eukprot:gnl/Dysnectes_brevis/4288_a5690_678.p2 GENE.gnl/Dysnectes_brevis/4288_a5690_678~~gnl/Dysnectes_brevis/4288_a5690_678.p2  ORF type:complete len:320 (+),score=48.58 gnl/Dysnectes_brevis/4288_a5690_678:41-961(+)